MTTALAEASHAQLVQHINHEGRKAARLMAASGRHAPETVIVLRRGSMPSLRNIHLRRRTQVFRLGNKGLILLDMSTGQPYMWTWTGWLQYCVPIDLERTEHHNLQKLLRRLRLRISECQ